ncbi:MAG: TonB-dependent receptor [Flavobacteriales bacterium]|nr:TonB-dependent receptor [Flavobacteriales bacterium]
MNTSFIKVSMLCMSLLAVSVEGFSQEKKNQNPSEVVNVEKNYTPQVKSKEKVNFNPSASNTSEKKLSVQYITELETPQAGFTTQSVNGMLLSNTQNETLYPNYIKAGYGYNLSTMADGYYSGTFGKTTLWAKLNHDRSERDVKPLPQNSVYSHTDASVGVRVDAGRYDVGGHVKYAYNSFTNNYMLTLYDVPAINAEKLKNSIYSGQVFVKAKKKGEIFDHFTLDASYYAGNEAAKEMEVIGNTRINIPIKSWTIAVDASLGYYDTQIGYINNAESENLLHLNLLPSISYKKGHWDLMAGVRMGILTGNGAEGSNFHIMPEAKASYVITDGLMTIYGAFTSGYKVNTLAELAYQCPYMGPINPSSYTREKYNVKIGLSGVISSAWHYDVYVSYVNQDYSPAWIQVIDEISQNIFSSYYMTAPDHIKVFTANASATYKISHRHNVGAFIQYNSASSDLFSKALYTPDFRVGASYRGSVVQDKIDLYGRVVFNGISNSAMYSDGVATEQNIESFVEYMGEASYNFTKRWSVFVQAKNSIDGRIPMYYGYEAPGFRGILGVKFNF